MRNHFCSSVLAMLAGTAVIVPSPVAAEEPFRELVAPFINTHCVKCHGPSKQSGDFRIDALRTGAEDAELWRAVREQLRDGSMPPAKEERPDSKKSQQVVAWIEAELMRAGQSAGRPLPQFGNDVPHELLFDPKNANVPASTPARYWRLSPFIYSKYMAKQHPAGGQLVSPFNLLPGNGFKDYALPTVIDEPTAALLWINAESLANARLRLDPKTRKLDRSPYRELGDAFDESMPAPNSATLTKIITEEFRRILGRPPATKELARWVELLNKNIADGDRATGLRMTLTAMFLHPEVLYRKEVGEGDADVHGRRRLSPRELTFAVAYALGDKWPDDTLTRAAEAGKLLTRADLIRELNRLFDDPKFEKTRIPRFFHEYFGYRGATNVFKTDYVHGLHLPADNVTDTDTLIRHILDRDKNVIAELLTTSEVFLITDQGGDKRHKPFYVYNFPMAPPPQKGKVRTLETAPPGQRAGILTQPSWLIAYSTNFDNHAIARGHWIRERLLGGSIPEIPITVDAKLPDDKDKGLRERMHVTRDQYCWRCHQRMDPLGLPFEMYNHFGRFRETETLLDPTAPPPAKGKPAATREAPVDATGAITGSGDPTLDGPVKNAVEMMKKLAASPRVEQVFVRHAFRYWLGRNECVADAGTLQAAHRAYQESGGSFRALVISLLTSDSFLYRTGEPPAVVAPVR